jgi:hypothetical protein
MALSMFVFIGGYVSASFADGPGRNPVPGTSLSLAPRSLAERLNLIELKTRGGWTILTDWNMASQVFIVKGLEPRSGLKARSSTAGSGGPDLAGLDWTRLKHGERWYAPSSEASVFIRGFSDARRAKLKKALEHEFPHLPDGRTPGRDRRPASPIHPAAETDTEAHGQPCAWCSDSELVISNMLGTINQSLVPQYIATCAVSALNGAKENLLSSFESLKLLVTDPEALWAKVVSDFDEFRKSVSHLSDSLSKFPRLLSHLSPDSLKAFLCPIAGGLAGAMLKASTPAGALLYFKKILNLEQRLAEFVAFLEKIERVKIPEKHRLNLATLAGQCAV